MSGQRVSTATGATVDANQSASQTTAHRRSTNLGTPNMSLLFAMGLAFLGGLILNAMPCVFPILSLKVLGFATGDPAEHRRHGIAYLIGVVSSFVLIASVLISLQTAGRWVGWGFQLQSTGFVIGLAYLFTLMGLSLSGLVLLGSRWMNLGAGLAAVPARGSFHRRVGGCRCQPPHPLWVARWTRGLWPRSRHSAIRHWASEWPPDGRHQHEQNRWLPKPGVWMETPKRSWPSRSISLPSGYCG